jgi:hypothetical protein
MKNVFEDVALEWEGVSFTIPANRMLRAIATVEDIITLPELAQSSQRGTPPMSKIAQAYGAVLRYAGCRVADDAVYGSMFGNEEAAANVMLAITGLMQIMLPPSAKKQMSLDNILAGQEPNQGNVAPAAQAKAKVSSKASTKQRSAA